MKIQNFSLAHTTSELKLCLPTLKRCRGHGFSLGVVKINFHFFQLITAATLPKRFFGDIGLGRRPEEIHISTWKIAAFHHERQPLFNPVGQHLKTNTTGLLARPCPRLLLFHKTQIYQVLGAKIGVNRLKIATLDLNVRKTKLRKMTKI